MTPEWIPFLSLLAAVAGGIFGAWVGVKVAVVRLETQMAMTEKRLDTLQTRSHRYNDDLLIHDGEIEQAFEKLDLKRARRQRVLE